MASHTSVARDNSVFLVAALQHVSKATNVFFLKILKFLSDLLLICLFYQNLKHDDGRYFIFFSHRLLCKEQKTSHISHVFILCAHKFSFKKCALVSGQVKEKHRLTLKSCFHSVKFTNGYFEVSFSFTSLAGNNYFRCRERLGHDLA